MLVNKEVKSTFGATEKLMVDGVTVLLTQFIKKVIHIEQGLTTYRGFLFLRSVFTEQWLWRWILCYCGRLREVRLIMQNPNYKLGISDTFHVVEVAL